MRPGSTLHSDSPIEGLEERPSLNPTGLLSLILLAIILLAGPSILGAVRPWIELPILGAVTLLLLLQALRLTVPAPLGFLRQIDAIDISVLLFVGYALIRWLTSPTEYFSRLEVLSVVGYAIVFLDCRYGMARRKYGVSILVLLAGLGVFEVIFGYLLHQHSNSGDPQSVWYPFGPTEQMPLYWAPRWVGTYGNPNNYACLIVMAAGAALALGCFSRFPWPARIVFFYLAAIMPVGILYSQSRGSWLSLFGGVLALIYFTLRYGTLRWWISLAGGAILAAIVAAIFLSSHLVDTRVAEATQLVDSGAWTKYLRYDLTEDALRIAHDYPLFGSGPATYTFLDPQYQGSTLDVRAVYTHDDYLNCLDDYGLVGLAIAMFFVFAVTLAMASKIQASSRWTERVLVAAGLFAWTALLVHSFLDFNLHIPANAMLLFALTGMALSRRPDEEARYHWSTFSLVRLGPALGWLLFAFGLLYGAQIVRTMLTDFPYEHAASYADVSPTSQSVQEVERALSFDSGNAPALVLLGDLHRLRASRAVTAEDRMTESSAALSAYQRALRANPLDASIKAKLGLTYDLLQRDSEAYFCYQAAVTAEPYNGRFWVALGNHLFSHGRLDQAEEAYLRAASCPRGTEGADDSAQQVEKILKLKNFLPPEPTMPALAPAPLATASPVPADASANSPAAPPPATSPTPDATAAPPPPPERPEPATTP